MAVDVKTLRVGSHILVDGKRGRVGGIRPCKPLNSFQIIVPHASESVVSFGYAPSASDMAQPIPITPDLLKELGFKWRKDSSCWRKYQNYDGKNYDWGIYAYEGDGGTWCFSLYLPNFLIKPQLYAEHLHEIEGQLGYYGVEPIKY